MFILWFLYRVCKRTMGKKSIGFKWCILWSKYRQGTFACFTLIKWYMCYDTVSSFHTWNCSIKVWLNKAAVFEEKRSILTRKKLLLFKEFLSLSFSSTYICTRINVPKYLCVYMVLMGESWSRIHLMVQGWGGSLKEAGNHCPKKLAANFN